MRSKSPDTMRKIIDYVEDYYFEHKNSPSTSTIAEGVKIGRATVHRYLVEMNECGMLDYDGKNITTKKIEKYQPKVIKVPVVGSIACGLPNIAEENIEEYVSLPESLFGKGKLFILKTSGTSMIKAGIEDGDLVVVRQQNTARNGEIVVALLGEEATLKRYYKEKDKIRLHPENETLDDIYVNDCLIQGVAIKVMKDL